MSGTLGAHPCVRPIQRVQKGGHMGQPLQLLLCVFTIHSIGVHRCVSVVKKGIADECDYDIHHTAVKLGLGTDFP